MVWMLLLFANSQMPEVVRELHVDRLEIARIYDPNAVGFQWQNDRWMVVAWEWNETGWHAIDKMEINGPVEFGPRKWVLIRLRNRWYKIRFTEGWLTEGTEDPAYLDKAWPEWRRHIFFSGAW